MLEKIIYLTDETDFMQNTDSGKPKSLHRPSCYPPVYLPFSHPGVAPANGNRP